jgi:hypothetical protein
LRIPIVFAPQVGHRVASDTKSMIGKGHAGLVVALAISAADQPARSP